MKKFLLILLSLPLIGLGQFPHTTTVTDSINYKYLRDSTICVGTWNVVHVDDAEYGERDNVYNLDFYIEIYKENVSKYSSPEYFIVIIRRNSGLCDNASSYPNLINSPVDRLIKISNKQFCLLDKDDWSVNVTLNFDEEIKTIDASNNLFTYGYGKQNYILIPQENKLDVLQRYVDYKD